MVDKKNFLKMIFENFKGQNKREKMAIITDVLILWFTLVTALIYDIAVESDAFTPIIIIGEFIFITIYSILVSVTIIILIHKLKKLFSIRK